MRERSWTPGDGAADAGGVPRADDAAAAMRRLEPPELLPPPGAAGVIMLPLPSAGRCSVSDCNSCAAAGVRSDAAAITAAAVAR